jgi:hypothetical protein
MSQNDNDENKTDLDDRLSRRFDSDTDTEDAGGSDQMSQSNSEQASQKSQNAQKTQNIKKEWNVRSFYLDDNLDRHLTTTFKRLDLEFSEADVDIELQKTRHFYPLLIMLGLERLEEMDVTEITEQLESTDR